MEENKQIEVEQEGTKSPLQFLNFQWIISALILNWKWFILSLIICLGGAAVYLRYTTPVYRAVAKLLIKEEEGRRMRGRSSLLYSSNLGVVSNSSGFENELEIIKAQTLALEAVKALKLYVTYQSVGKVKDVILYRNQPITADLDSTNLKKLARPINLEITKEDNTYHLTGTYYVSVDEENIEGPFSLDRQLPMLPAKIGTRMGTIILTANNITGMTNGSKVKITINPPINVAKSYAASISTGKYSGGTDIAQLAINDPIGQRAIDYLTQLVVCYNQQANEDKNAVAIRTEQFINNRLEKINSELGSTEGQLEKYKRSNRMVSYEMSSGAAFSQTTEFEQKLAEANTQLALINNVSSYINDPSNKYQTLPVNVGIEDQSTNSLISKYNELALERNRLLRSASETSPSVTPITAQLNDLMSAIKNSMNQSRKNFEIKRNSIASQLGRYSGEVSQSPEQERILSQIGRQQEVKSSLYLMLLQKREENSISLAATADKGKLLDPPVVTEQVSPNRRGILLGALVGGLAIPAFFIILAQLLRTRIEDYNDVVTLTKLPIIASVPIASETAKTKANIVVHENQNNQMEEVFRTMRTNLQFMIKENQKVIMFTSTISGEGKTFNTANLAVSFALLGKKVVLVGLDIRKPKLAELFEIDNHHSGITPLLTHDEPTWSEIKENILPSGVNNNLDLLLSGPTPPNPTELVARKSLDVIMEQLKEHYDYVIIDTAPVGLVTDTLQIARVADAAVYVCRADHTPKDSFNLINSLSAEKKLTNMSIVINGIDLSKKKYGSYYGYGRYGKYRGYGHYGNYISYGNYKDNHYADKNDTSVKR